MEDGFFPTISYNWKGWQLKQQNSQVAATVFWAMHFIPLPLHECLGVVLVFIDGSRACVSLPQGSCS